MDGFPAPKNDTTIKTNRFHLYLRRLALLLRYSSALRKILHNQKQNQNRKRKRQRSKEKLGKQLRRHLVLHRLKQLHFQRRHRQTQKKVIAPYREKGIPKDLTEGNGEKYRLTYPSNIWTDITIPFWSMPENTPHPTQKPEKLLAKIILASSNESDTISDPFSGVGTTGVVAKKLKRNFVMIEIDEEYCLYALKRLKIAEQNPTIQGYSHRIFLERNTFSLNH